MLAQVKPVQFDVDPAAGVGNYEVSSDDLEYFTASSEAGGLEVEAVGEGTAAALEATAVGADATVAATTAVEATGLALSEVAACVSIALAPVGVIGAVAGLITLILAILEINELLTINVVNNTPYNIYTSVQPQYDQVYLAHGKMVTYPAGVISPNNGLNAFGSTYAFANDSGSLIGPSGAFWIQIQDPANANVLGGLCVAYADPVSGDNSIAVSFNQNLESFYNSFNSAPAQIASSATLPSQTINGTNYPALSGTAGLSATNGSNPTVNLVLSVVS